MHGTSSDSLLQCRLIPSQTSWILNTRDHHGCNWLKFAYSLNTSYNWSPQRLQRSSRRRLQWLLRVFSVRRKRLEKSLERKSLRQRNPCGVTSPRVRKFMERAGRFEAQCVALCRVAISPYLLAETTRIARCVLRVPELADETLTDAFETYIDWQQPGTSPRRPPQQVIGPPTSPSPSSAPTFVDHTSRQLVVVPANAQSRMDSRSALIVDWLLAARFIHGLLSSSNVVLNEYVYSSRMVEEIKEGKNRNSKRTNSDWPNCLNYLNYKVCNSMTITTKEKRYWYISACSCYI